MIRLLRQALVIARRDFVSIVVTPTFLVFLLAPLLMVAISTVGGMGARHMADSAGASERIVAIMPAQERMALAMVNERMRRIAGGKDGPPQLEVLAADSVDAAGLARLRGDADVLAIMTGDAAHPAIAQRSENGFPGRYLALLAEQVAREGAVQAAQTASASVPSFTIIKTGGPGRMARSGLASGAVFVIFLLILMLAGQSVGMLAEEKGNKVIEILAAAVPLESVFFGKLLGMMGVAMMFVAFWGAMIGGAVALFAAQMPEAATTLAALNPAVGWPMFITLTTIYFLMAFLLLGAVYLGIGAIATSVREIQMMALPITFFQVGMFGLSSAAANAPGSSLATFAQWLPWSSPFSMAARAATDATLWPHLVALAWQGLWLAISIWLSVRIFRVAVLRSGGFNWRFWRKTANG